MASLTQQIGRTQRAVHLAGRAAFQGLQVGPNHADVLIEVLNADEPPMMRDVSVAIAIKPNAVTMLVRDLEHDDLLVGPIDA